MDVIYENPENELLIVKYKKEDADESKSVDIFSSKEWAEEHKEELKSFARYNPSLTYEGEKRKGWISPLSNKKLHEFLKEEFDVELSGYSEKKEKKEEE